jgi:hypothetical protein
MSERRSNRRRLSLLFAVLAALVLVLVPTPAGARVVPMDWHRLDTGLDGRSDPPGHEVLHCLTDGQWRCSYSTRPGPGLADSPFRADFAGDDVTDSWTCPPWLSTDVCASVERVVAGTETVSDGRDHLTFTIPVELIVLGDGTLWVLWPLSEPPFEVEFRPFACPWYPTFEQALQASAGCQTPNVLP